MNPILFPAAVIALLSGAMLATPVHQDPAPAAATTKTAPQKSEVQVALDDIRKILLTGGRAHAEQVAPRLRELGTQKLETRDRESWLRLARDAALRLGDRKWLESLREIGDSFSNEVMYGILLAMGRLERADLAGARAMLDQIDLDGINPREERRALAIRARIAQLEGKVEEEREQIERLLDHLPSWPTQKCQSCHGPVKDEKPLSTLPIAELWFGERYVELMRQQGDADAVRKAAAERLEAAPDDDDARIRLAFALQALGQAEAATARFRELPWAAFPDRTIAKPRMMTSFP